eukprot:758066-Hanusia_phi.AAC.1
MSDRVLYERHAGHAVRSPGGRGPSLAIIRDSLSHDPAGAEPEGRRDMIHAPVFTPTVAGGSSYYPVTQDRMKPG